MNKLLLKYSFALGIMLFLGIPDMFGQGLNVTGTVTSDDGNLLPGVNVSVIGTSIGSVSDQNGSYNLKNLKANSKLRFSFVGFKTLDVSIGNQSKIDVSLKRDDVGLEEVIVVGYGSVKKSDLTGSVASIKAAELKQTPIVSLDQGLQGRAPGVQVTQNSGAPGGAVSIRIRGGNSISSSNEPLYVIDGFPVSGAVVTPSGPGFGSNQSNGMNALAGLNPNDIESLEVLKDAAATSIYGSRGANGVVLITTKRGKAGKTKVEVESYYGMQSVNRLLPLMNAEQNAAFENELTPGRFPQVGTYGEGTNWQKELFRQAPINSNQITISGGNEKTQFSTATNYFSQDGIIKGSDFKRVAFRLNLDHQFNSKVKFGSNLSLSKLNSNVVNNSQENGVVWSALLMSPLVPVYNAQGFYTNPTDFNSYYAGTPSAENPLAMAEYMKNDYNTLRILGNVFSEVKILDNLTYRFSLGTDIYNDTRNVFIPRTTQAGRVVNGSGGRGIVDQFTYLHESVLNWNPNLGKNHTLNVTGVFSTQSQSQDRTGLSATNFPSDALAENALSIAATQNTSTNKTLWRLDSYTTRLNYNYKERYLLSLTTRIDGSSRFGDGNKYGFFPSLAFAWRIVEEEFMKQQNVFSDLKLRLSYGRTGNAEVPLYQSLFKLGTSGNFDYVFNNARFVGIGAQGIPNPDLKWETTESYNGGLDFSVLNNRLTFNADVYYKLTSDLLLGRTIPSSSGFSNFFGNFGQVENKGFELGVNGILVNKNDFVWNVSSNISFNRNKIVKLDGKLTQIIPAENGGGVAAFANNSVLRVGEPVGSFFGYVYDGLWQKTDNIKTSHMPSSIPGNARFKDVNGDGKLTDADRVIIGDPNPDFIYAFSTNLNYKKFDFSLFLQGVQGNEIFNVVSRLLETAGGGSNQRVEVINRWTPNNPSNTYVLASRSQRIPQSDKYIEDGSFLRLKNVSLGYTVSLKSQSKMRVYVSGNNLFTLTNYWGFDPEVNTTGQSDVTNFGIDNGGFPVAKSLIAGLQFTF